MVCEKNAGTAHDFMKDPIELVLDGDLLRANNTTLGADNGTAVALCMAILEDKSLKHPLLEIILTTEEETGMAGAEGLDASLFSATRMLNLDSSEEKIITIGCAAGVTVEYELPTTTETAALPPLTAYTISVKGLRGGHSGADIHKGYGNALVILGCVLASLEKGCGIQIAAISGGMKLNAIPREATAEIVTEKGQEEKITACIKECSRAFKEMYKATEAGLTITHKTQPQPQRILTAECTDKIIASLLLLPNGVQAMSQEMPGVVAASCNVGVVETTESSVLISCFPRGATQDFLKKMEAQISVLAERTGAAARFIQRSPAWAFNPQSQLLNTVVACYKKQNGEDPTVTAIHAGLECGILAEKIPGLDIVSLGPDTFDLHTPDERLSVSSLQRVWKFLLSLLEEL
jgi:dipeptidase D